MAFCEKLKNFEQHKKTRFFLFFETFLTSLSLFQKLHVWFASRVSHFLKNSSGCRKTKGNPLCMHYVHESRAISAPS